MIILGIETSCDETAVALVEGRGGRLRVLKETVTSQIRFHRKYGGVVPEVAARRHAEMIVPAIEQTLGRPPRQSRAKASRNQHSIDAIAVTGGPGLMTSLLVGVEAARVLSLVWKKPVVRVNHIEGHMYSAWLTRSVPRFPALCLTVSGGHTELIRMANHGRYRLVGRTLDDAAGEAFDKVAKILGLPYPGGPEVSHQAEGGDPKAFAFPRPMMESGGNDFSFSGLKTAVLYTVRGRKQKTPAFVRDVCASFQEAVVETLVVKTIRAAEKIYPRSVLLAGGVSANTLLRKRLRAAVRETGATFHVPRLSHTGDNAAMIAAAGYFNVLRKNVTPWERLTADPNWELVE